MHAKFRSREIKLNFWLETGKNAVPKRISENTKTGVCFSRQMGTRGRLIAPVLISRAHYRYLSSAPTRLFNQLEFIVFGKILKKPQAAFSQEIKFPSEFSPRRILSRKNFRFGWKSRFVSKSDSKIGPFLKKGYRVAFSWEMANFGTSVKWISTWETMEGRKCFDFTSEERRLLEGKIRRRFRRVKECGKIVVC